MFLHMPTEENPFLGWRAIRVCLDEPELFRTQLRALLRATAHGDVRIMLPLVNDVEEVRRVRELLEEEEEQLERAGHPVQLGVQARRHDRDARRGPRRGGTRPALRFLLDRHQRPRPVHARRGPDQHAPLTPLQPVPPVRGAPPAPGGAGEPGRGHRGERVRGDGLATRSGRSCCSGWTSRPSPWRGRPFPRSRSSSAASGSRTRARRLERRSPRPTSKAVADCLVAGIGDSVDLKVFQGRWSLSVPD